jgi:hypothetical protein
LGLGWFLRRLAIKTEGRGQRNLSIAAVFHLA